MRCVGTTSPGNTEWENDDGVVGTLYDNPNTLINAQGTAPVRPGLHGPDRVRDPSARWDSGSAIS